MNLEAQYATAEVKRLPSPQEGPQTDFCEAAADIVIFGGSAGGGKSYGLLLKGAQHVRVPGYTCVIFRRNSKQVMAPGGLWEKASNLYPTIDGHSRMTDKTWTFKTERSAETGASSSVIQFSHLENEQDKISWDGAELAGIGFDELQHFSETQFFYLASRNRSTSGVRCQIFGTCNPYPNWLRTFLAPWVDTKYDDPAESGEVRYFDRINDEVVWVPDDYLRPLEKCGDISKMDPETIAALRKPKSVTFIRSTIYDNPALIRANPEYLTTLQSLKDAERRRLLLGEWNVFEGAFFAEWKDEGEDAHSIIAPYEAGKQPRHWRYFGGLDWGYGSPFAFVLCAVDEDGRVHVLGELHERMLTTPQQSGKVLGLLNAWGVDRGQCLIAADPRMFSKAKRADLIGEADIEAFHRAGLQCVEANDNREHGWNRVRDYLQSPDRFKVWRGCCSHLIEQFPLMQYSKVKPNDMDTDGDDHLHDCLRYALMTRPRASDQAPPAASPQSSIQNYLIGHKRTGGGYA